MEHKHEKYERLIARCKAFPPTRTALAHPCDESSLRAATDAAQAGLITPILVGPRARIEAVAKEHGIDISKFEIVDAPHSEGSAAMAVALVRQRAARLGDGGEPQIGADRHRRVELEDADQQRRHQRAPTDPGEPDDGSDPEAAGDGNPIHVRSLCFWQATPAIAGARGTNSKEASYSRKQLSSSNGMPMASERVAPTKKKPGGEPPG